MRYAIFIDIESNGLDPARHRCLEIAFRVVDVRNGEEKAAYSSLVKQDEAIWARSDLVSLSINGFTFDQVQVGKTEQVISREIVAIFQGLKIHRSNSFFLAQNPSFDRAFFSQLISITEQDRYQWPYHWLDFASMYWALEVQQIRSKTDTDLDKACPSLSKDAIAAQYGLPPEEKPHRAMRGVEHLITCYAHVVGWNDARLPV